MPPPLSWPDTRLTPIGLVHVHPDPDTEKDSTRYLGAGLCKHADGHFLGADPQPVASLHGHLAGAERLRGGLD